MTVRKIVYHGDPALHRRCELVTVIDDSVRALIQDLVDTLYSTTGVGLAAPQIGVNKCVFIYDAVRSGDKRTYKVLLNPRITDREGDTLSEAEGCKSAPELCVDIPRSAQVQVEGLDETGQHVSFRAHGFEAIVIQHEMDHLEGKLVTDRLAPEVRASYERRLAGIVRMQSEPWYVNNLAAIHKRLRPVESLPEGVLFKQRKSSYQILVMKDDSQVQLYFAEPKGDIREVVISGIMSRVDLRSPLELLGIYTQVMMLCLLWKPEPRSVYLLGFGGGRVPMVLHHYYPELMLVSTEIDPTVVALAKRFFGIQVDNRMKIFVEDGRTYLKNQSADVRYDVILVDCYTGPGLHPFALSTTEFYDLCRSHLAEDGVVVSNLVSSDPLFHEKMHTLVSSFSYVRRFEGDGVDVFFGSDVELPGPEIVRRADQLYERFSFPFPFRELVRNLHSIRPHETTFNSGRPLSDTTDRNQLAGGLSPDDPIFYGVKRNDPCPCGSGKKFKKCHGQP